MLSYSFNQLGIFVEYISDVEAFTEMYCENKDKPEMECNGKCHLADQLAEKQEQKQSKEIQSPPEVLLFCSTLQIDFVKSRDFYILKKSTFNFNADLTDGTEHTIFQPPQA
jgi:hypothetical protein